MEKSCDIFFGYSLKSHDILDFFEKIAYNISKERSDEHDCYCNGI